MCNASIPQELYALIDQSLALLNDRSRPELRESMRDVLRRLLLAVEHNETSADICPLLREAGDVLDTGKLYRTSS